MGNSGIYIAAAGGMAQYERLEHLTNNLANVATTGFKAERPVFSVQRPNYQGQLRMTPAPGSAEERRALAFASLDEVRTDLSHGAFEATGNPLDLAIGGDGFFAVAADEGTLYTRAGAMRLDEGGRLVNASGMPVLSSGGSDIYVPPGTLAVDEGGTISVDGEAVATLQIAQFDPSVRLERVGHSMFRAVNEEGAPAQPSGRGSPQVMQGTLESSNVNAVSAMVELIATNRAFEQFTKSLQAIDDIDEKAISQMARPG